MDTPEIKYKFLSIEIVSKYIAQNPFGEKFPNRKALFNLRIELNMNIWK